MGDLPNSVRVAPVVRTASGINQEVESGSDRAGLNEEMGTKFIKFQFFDRLNKQFIHSQLLQHWQGVGG